MRRVALLLFFAVAATVVFTWPQVARLGNAAPAHIDSTFNVWRVSWVAHQLPRDPARLFDANIFYPVKRTFALSDPILVPALIGAPFIWAGLPPITTTNLLVLLAFVTNMAAASWLAWRLTQSWPAALLAGLIFGFAPYRFEHFMHLELLWACWMPLTLIALHRLLERGRVRDGILMGGCFSLQALSCLYYAVFFGTTLVLLTPLLLWKARRAPLATVVCGGLVAAIVVAAVVMPYVQPFLRNRYAVGERNFMETVHYSGRVEDFFAAPPSNWLHGTNYRRVNSAEGRLLPGAVAVAAAGLIVVPPYSAVSGVYLLGTVFAIDATLGFNGRTYPWLYAWMPGYHGLRVPSRFAGIFLLMLSVAAAFGLARVLARLTPVPRALVAGVVLLIVSVEYLTIPVPLAPLSPEVPAVYDWLRRQPPVPIAEAPLPSLSALPGYDSIYQYWSIFHWRPLVNGYSGFYPPQYLSVVDAMDSFPDDTTIDILRVRGARYLLVHGRFYRPDAYARVVAALDARTDCRLEGVFPDGHTETRAYLIHSRPH